MFRYFVAFMLFSFSALAEVPKEWIEKSKSEPQLKIGGVWEDRIARKIIDDFSSNTIFPNAANLKLWFALRFFNPFFWNFCKRGKRE